jgi:hypothetical protein
VLGVLNRHYAWNLPGVSREQANKNTLSAAELPKLTDSSANCTIEKQPDIVVKVKET